MGQMSYSMPQYQNDKVQILHGYLVKGAFWERMVEPNDDLLRVKCLVVLQQRQSIGEKNENLCTSLNDNVTKFN